MSAIGSIVMEISSFFIFSLIVKFFVIFMANILSVFLSVLHAEIGNG